MIKNQGFSLSEVLIGVALLGIIGGILVTIIVNSGGLISSQNLQINHSLSLNSANTEIENSVKEASSIINSYSSPPGPFNTSTSVLVYNIPSINGSGQIISATFDTVVIAAQPGAPKILKKYLFPNASSSRTSESRVLLTNLSLLRFYYLDANGNQVSPTSANTIEYIINLTEKDNYGSKESSSSGRVNLNNTL